MTYIDLSNFVTLDVLPSADMNQILDNIRAVKEPPEDNYTLNEGADYTTTSTSMVDVDATNLALAITTTGGDVEVGFPGAVSNSTNGAAVSFDLWVDGALLAGNNGIIGCTVPAANRIVPMHFTVTIPLAAGAHTINLRWRVGSGTGKLYAGAAFFNGDFHPKFYAVERG